MKTSGTLFLLALLLPLAPNLMADEPGALSIDVRVDRTTNLIVWVDNMAGSSIGKTAGVYRRYWLERFGPLDQKDREALAEFKRVRDLSFPRPGGVVNKSGCLPLEEETLFWNQKFMALAMQAESIDGFAESLKEEIGPLDAAAIQNVLSRFDGRFQRVWKDLRHIRRFDKKLKRFLARGGLPAYLDELAGFFEVKGRAHPSMKMSLIGLPYDGATHAEADGDHLLVEIRPSDTPEDQIPVLAHEATHFLMRRMTPEQHDQLAREAFGAGLSGAIYWRFLWEAIPTGLGQGLAEARLAPDRFSTEVSWYHIERIDRIAKLTYPALAQAVNSGETIQGGIIGRVTRLLDEAGLPRVSPATGWLATSFWMSGSGLDLPLLRLRIGLGLGASPSSPHFGLDEPAAAEFLREYECLGGVILLRPAEIDRAVQIDGATRNGLAAQIRRHTDEGRAVIASSRRPAGGVVFFLVAPDTRDVKALFQAFLRLRGVPEEPLPLPPTVAKDR